jgi:hypothetical protein
MEIRAAAPPKAEAMLRTFKPEDQVQARLQLSGRGFLHKPVAGIDVRGDGTFVPFRGRVGREELDASERQTPFDVVRETLAQEGQ